MALLFKQIPRSISTTQHSFPSPYLLRKAFTEIKRIRRACIQCTYLPVIPPRLMRPGNQQGSYNNNG